MISIKKTSKLFAKKDTKNNDEAIEEEVLKEALATSDSLDDADADPVWEPKTEEEIKQKALILKIRELLGEDTSVPIRMSYIKKLEEEKLEEERKAFKKLEAEKSAEAQTAMPQQKTIVKENSDEIWEPKTEEEKLQHASMLRIRELLGQDTNVPIKKSEVTKTEVVNFVPPKRIKEEKVAVSADSWVPRTEDEKRQQAAILKIRELLGEDVNVPIEKHQRAKTQMLSSIEQKEPVKRDPKAIIRCGDEKEEEEKSTQYLLLKKLLQEDNKTDAKKPASGGNPESSKPAVLPFGIGNAFTIGAIRNAEPTNKASKENLSEVKPARTSQASGGINHFSVSAVVNSETKNVQPIKENKKEEERVSKIQIQEQLKGHVKVHAEEQDYKRPPEAKNPNSGFFLFDFKELTK